MNDIDKMSHEELKNRYMELLHRSAELQVLNQWYEEQFKLLKHRLFSSSSERTDKGQLHLFNEAEKESKPEVASPPEQVTVPEHKRQKKQKGLREIQLKDLPQETVEHEIPESERVCACCGEAIHKMSTETRQELSVVPAKIKVVNHVRHIYSCRHCEKAEVTTPVVTAPMPAPPIAGSFASASLIAYVMSQKYSEGLPLYRQEKLWERFGIELSRQTMSNWVLAVTDRWLKPVFDYMKQQLVTKDILHADETTVQVINETGRDTRQQSYIWLYRTGREGPPIVLYEYQPSRAGDNPTRFLKGFSGYLHTDGYEAYAKIPNITLVGCWAHARRKFDEALKVLPANIRDQGGTASHQGLEFCNRLFAVERSLKSASPKDRYEKRIEMSLPILGEFKVWLDDHVDKVLSQGALAKAINYCLNQWPKLNNFLLDGRLEIDNNRSERSIKPFVIGRKNWLFSNTPAGAEASAIAYSIVETAKENNLNPMTYLEYLLEQLPNSNLKDETQLDRCLPWSKELPPACHMPTIPTALLNDKK